MSQNILKFDWNEFYCQEKVDGSLILIYFYRDKICINTRNSYGNGKINNSDVSWESVVLSCIKDTSLLNKKYTYIAELCSPYNQIVKIYQHPELYLLTIFESENELNFGSYEVEAARIGLKTPKTFKVRTAEELDKLIQNLELEDKTNEGVVLRDISNNRIKCKTSSYLLLHHLSNNGNIVSTKNLVDIILKGEEDEMITYFPFIKDRLLELKDKFNKLVDDLDNIFYSHWDQTSRKKFAEEVKKHPLSCVLFSLYGTNHYKPGLIREKISGFKDKVIEYLEKK